MHTDSVRGWRRIGTPLLCVLLTTLLPCQALKALEQETQTWTTGQILLPVTEGLDTGLRYRTRFSGIFDKRRLYQYQLTLGHTLDDRHRVRLGYEQFRAPGGRTEHRFFPELQLRSQLGDAPLRHRLRVEWREIDGLRDPVFRLRYKLAYRRPLGIGDSYLELRNEVFISLSQVDPFLERGVAQNRIGFTVGHPMSRRSRLELRYQWGYIDDSVIDRGENLIQLHWIWDGR